MKGATRIANIDGLIVVMVDGVAVKKTVSRATLDAVAGQPTKLFLEFELPEETHGAYDVASAGLSLKAKALCAIEILSYLQPEDVEDVLAESTKTGTLGFNLLATLANLVERRFIKKEEDGGDTEWTGPELRADDFPTLS